MMTISDKFPTRRTVLVEMKETHTALVFTNFLERSPARHAWGVMVMGLRAKGWGSTMLRERVRQRRRAWVGDGMAWVEVCVVV